MKLKKMILLSMVLLCTILHSFGQTADEVVNKYFDAIGGKEKLASLKSAYSEGDVTIMNNPAPFVTSIIDGKAYRTEVDFNGQKVINCYTVNSGWTVNPLAGMPDAVALPADQVSIGKMTFDLKGPLFDYVAKERKLEMLGKETLNGASVYKLKLTGKDGTEMYFFIDDGNYYLLKSTMKLSAGGNQFEIVTINSNYKKTDSGLLFPYTQEISYPGLTVISTTKILSVNKEIDPAIFAQPKK